MVLGLIKKAVSSVVSLVKKVMFKETKAKKIKAIKKESREVKKEEKKERKVRVYMRIKKNIKKVVTRKRVYIVCYFNVWLYLKEPKEWDTVKEFLVEEISYLAIEGWVYEYVETTCKECLEECDDTRIVIHNYKDFLEQLQEFHK